MRSWPRRTSRRNAAGVEVVEQPSVREGIAVLVERTGPDVVCLASHGRTGLKHVVLGSIAEHTLRTAGVPVLVVKKTTPPAADEPLRVLLALDLGDGSEELVGEAARLLGRRDELALAHVVESIYWSPGLYGTELSLPQPDVPRLREASLEQMRNIPLPESAPRVSHHVAAGKPGQEIVALQEGLGAHVTIVHTHGRRAIDRLLLGSVAEYVARCCAGAVYVVPR